MTAGANGVGAGVPRGWRRVDVVAVVVAASAAVAAAWVRERTAVVPDSMWWSSADQQRYLQSALAWAAGRLDPADHWYMPGYPLLAAPFVRVVGFNPFLVPDLAVLAATMWLAAALGAWLAPGWRWARVAVAAAALASVLPPLALDIWVIPWTSTPETALSLAALLAVMHLMVRPAPTSAFWAGVCAGGLLAFRPVDAAVVSLVVFGGWLFAMLCAWPGPAVAARTAVAGLGGAALAVVPTVAAYWAVNGWQLNGYLALSAAIGFEWRLLPLRWVTIMLSPRPLYPEGVGMIVRFPWLATGIAGLVACLVRPPAHGLRRTHLLVGGAVLAHVALYLCYRDLHPQALWRYGNYHYFKWPLLLMAVYSVLLVRLLLERRWGAVSTGVVVLALVLPWRAELERNTDSPPATQTGSVLRFAAVSLGVRDAIVVPATASFDAIFRTQHDLYVGGHEETWYSSTGDFRTVPQLGGLMIAPLRPFRAGAVTIHFGPGVRLGPGQAYLAHQRLVLGMPCWLPHPIGRCV